MFTSIPHRWTTLWRLSLIALSSVFLIGFTSACAVNAVANGASSDNVNATNQKSVSVDMKNMAYSPATLTVSPGTTVTWRNDDMEAHTVTSGVNGKPDGTFDSKNMPFHQRFSYTFKKTGTYNYYCTYHLTMVGTVIVTDKATNTNGSAAQTAMAGMNASTSSTTASTGNGTMMPLGTGTSDEPKGKDDIRLLPYTMENGYKVFHMTAQPVWWQVKPGVKVQAWAYNGTVPGPEIKVDQGDKVKIEVTNKLAEGTTVHWHGLDVPFAQDGTGGVSQPDIKPGQTWTYTFTVTAPPGTYMYHSHPMNDMLKQENMGLFGAFIVEPKDTGWQQVHPGYQDEYTIFVNDSPEFGYTINGLSYPATPVLPAKVGDKVLIHLINLGSMDHPMHLHGFHFQVINEDGYPLRNPETLDTINTAPGSTYDLSFVANQPGKWLFHCHILEHVTDSKGNMTGMVTMFDVTQ